MASRTGRGVGIALVVSLVAAGCAGGGAGSGPPEPAFEGDLSQVLTIEIRNDQMDEARVQLWIDRNRERLGVVRGFSIETFHHPMDRIAQVHMEFDLTLGEHCVTQSISLGPGDDISVTIPSNLNMMAAVCRRN